MCLLTAHGGYCGIIRHCSFLPSTCFQVKWNHSPLGALPAKVEFKPPIICHVIELKAYACSSQVYQLFSFQWCTHSFLFQLKKVDPVLKQRGMDVLSDAWEGKSISRKHIYFRPLLYGLNHSTSLCCTGSSCLECVMTIFPSDVNKKLHVYFVSYK